MKVFTVGSVLALAALAGTTEAFIGARVSSPAAHREAGVTSATAQMRTTCISRRRGRSGWGSAGAARAATAARHPLPAATVVPKTTTMLRANPDDTVDTQEKARNVSGVGSTGSNILLLLSAVMVVKGLLLPEEIRHMSFCPSEDPIRGRDTLPWRMMQDSGRQCGSIKEVTYKYITAPLAFPGTPEWGMMLNVKEDMAKDAWFE